MELLRGIRHKTCSNHTFTVFRTTVLLGSSSNSLNPYY
ncbi:uncharacterized protein FFB14_15314 [Fusarium fujikuroi]|nr:uncharacterized protein FFB14_15314 [Fusarium fujikuroi]